MKKILMTIVFMASTGSVFALNQFDAQRFKNPVREVAIIASDEGYYPNKVSIFAGEKLRLLVTSTAEKDQCLIIENHSVFMPAVKGKIADKEVVVDKPGRYKFYCPSTKFTGSLTVLEKPLKEKQKIKRDVASEAEKKKHYWVPRNYDE